MKKSLYFLLASLFLWNCFLKKNSNNSDCNSVAGVSCETTSVSGTIVDEDENAVAEADIILLGEQSSENAKRSAKASKYRDTLATAKSDDDGRFKFKDLVAGDYLLKVLKDDSQGAVREFTLETDEPKDLGDIVIKINSIVIGSVDKSIVQQAKTAFAEINEIGQKTEINRNGDFVFHNVPVTNNYYTISIYVEGDKVETDIDNIQVNMEKSSVVVINTEGSKEVESAIFDVKIPLSDRVLSVLDQLDGGKLRAVLSSKNQKTLKLEVRVEGGEAKELIAPVLIGGLEWHLKLEGEDSKGLVIFSGELDFSLKDKMPEKLDIDFKRRTASLVIKQEMKDKLYKELTSSRKLTLSGHGIDSLVLTADYEESGSFKVESLPLGRDMLLELELLDGDKTAHYQGDVTHDILGEDADTAKISLKRLEGALSLKGRFVDSNGDPLKDLKWDSALVKISGKSMETLRKDLKPDGDGKFSTVVTGIPAGEIRIAELTGYTEGRDRFFLDRDTVTILVRDTVEWSRDIRAKSKVIITFTLADVEITVGDTAAPEFKWDPTDPEDASIELESLDADVVAIDGGRFWGKRPGSAMVVASIAGLAHKDTFNVKVRDAGQHFKSLAIRDTSVLVGEKLLPLGKWDPSDAEQLGFQLQSENTDLATISGDTVLAKAAGTVKITATVPDRDYNTNFIVTILIPFDSITVSNVEVPKGTRFKPEITWYPPESEELGYSMVSSETSIAEIEGDTVVAVAAGQASITVSVNDRDYEKSFNSKITAIPSEFDSLSAQDMSIVVNDALSPNLTWYPSSADSLPYELTSLQPAIASVDGATITGQAAGTADVEILVPKHNYRDTFQVAVSNILVSDSTFVSGTIVNQTWNRAASPYCITDDIFVAGLSIEAGVEVVFFGNYVFEVGGLISAIGTEKEVIKFTKIDTIDSWKGILFQNTVPGSVMSWCIIEHANTGGIRLIESFPTLDHCVIRNNKTSSYGGGLQVQLTASGELEVSNCIIENNSTSTHGGGIWVSTENATVRFIKCTIQDNSVLGKGGGHVGGGARVSGSVDFIQCQIKANSVKGGASGVSKSVARGGGVYIDTGPVNFNNSVISENSIHANSFFGDATSGGGAHIEKGPVSFKNSILGSNTASSSDDTKGGGIFANTGQIEIRNSTLIRNSPHAIHAAQDTIMIKNSIIYFNNSDNVQIKGNVGVSYSNVQGGFPGEGNINFNPVLNSNIIATIVEGSPAIDAGDPDASFNDVCFPPSLGGERNDMGAHGGPGACNF